MDWLACEDFKKEYVKVPIVEYPNKVLYRADIPSISIVVITFNHKDFIKECIEGILEQKTNVSFEIILCDDQSSDGTTEICKQIARSNPNIVRLFLNSRENNIKILDKPCGIFQMSHGLLSARGKYLALLSGDDYWNDETKLQKQFDFLEQNVEFSYCYHDLVRMNQNGDDLHYSEPLASDMPVTLFARNIFNKLPRQFLEVLQEDTFMKSMLLLSGKGKYLNNIKPAIYRVHGNNIWGIDDNKFKHKSRILTDVKLLEAYKGTQYEQLFRLKAIETILLKSEFLVKIGDRKYSRLSINCWKELNHYGLLWLYLSNFIKKKILRK